MTACMRLKICLSKFHSGYHPVLKEKQEANQRPGFTLEYIPMTYLKMDR
jgi:hypothetical protein